MKNLIISLALLAGLAACGSGGSPFQTVTEEETTDGAGGEGDGAGGDDGTPVEEEGGIPDELTQLLDTFEYDPNAQTLTVVGVPTDDGTLNGVYRRRPGLDRAGYEAYTAQDGSLDRHLTAYVKDIRGTQSITIVSGGQFEEVLAGNQYKNSTYSPPVSPGSTADGGLVTYAGTYAGLLNGGGSREDLLPVTPGTPDAPLSNQAAEVIGRTVVTGDFTDSSVTGIIFERRVVDVNAGGFQEVAAAEPFEAENIALDLTDIAEDGSFDGVATLDDGTVGTYGGIFGGNGATEVAGSVVLNGHIPEFQGVIENGTFVLSQCGQADEDPICDQPIE